jgi:DNA-binding transcriptional MerR regulator
MFSIGEFSKMTALSIKSLRLYHEKELLIPADIDSFTGYRYYNNVNFETAKKIKILKQLDFTLIEIRDILKECKDESDIIHHLEKKQKEVESKLSRYTEMSRSIQTIISMEKEVIMKSKPESNIVEKEIKPMLIAGYRMKGCYEEEGKGFQILRKTMGLVIAGKAMTLYYDGEYKEADADLEPCFPIRKGKGAQGISIRELSGGKAVTLIHRGPYEMIGESYKKIFSYIHEKGYSIQLPHREIYLKGPGMIFQGSPQKYLTEIMIMIGA